MSWAIWITGLPGSGKSALARETARQLSALDGRVTITVLELDEIRRGLTPTPTYRDEERDLVYRVLAWIAATLTEAGVPVIVDATAHRRAWRDRARARIGRFAEVQLVCPLELCREREEKRTGSHAPRAIYARAGRAGARVPGVDVAYEPALSPELSLDTATRPLAELVGEVVALARRLAADSPSRTPATSPGWVIWITGRPGSGKTTLARGVADALAAEGTEFKLLERPELRRALLTDGVGRPAGEEVVHRALAVTAKLLAEAGVPVIVDATTSRRAWREMARTLIPCFVEVQLVCPTELCAERERAARWKLGTAPPAGARTGRTGGEAPALAEPELCLDYEESLAPELTLHTHLQGHWSTVRQVLLLTRRLLHPETPNRRKPERRTPCECES